MDKRGTAIPFGCSHNMSHRQLLSRYVPAPPYKLYIIDIMAAPLLKPSRWINAVSENARRLLIQCQLLVCCCPALCTAPPDKILKPLSYGRSTPIHRNRHHHLDSSCLQTAGTYYCCPCKPVWSAAKASLMPSITVCGFCYRVKIPLLPLLQKIPLLPLLLEYAVTIVTVRIYCYYHYCRYH